MSSADLSVLRGQRVLITGAARGIGAALAERLASHGARLALVGLEPETMAAVAERCGEGTFVAECDVSSNDQVTQAIDAAAEAFGGLDVVVANAGIATGGPLRSQDLRSWERVIEINLLGVMYTNRAALRHLERNGGYVLNIASTAAVLRGPGLSAYCAAKAGVEALSDCLRVEMEPLGVKVGVAYFLFLDTDMVRDGERESPIMRRAKAEVPRLFSRTYPLSPAIDEVVTAIAQRRRRVAFPRWFLKLVPLRQLFASRWAERRAGRNVPEALREHEQLVAERGASAASASERTRDLARL
jgi:NAD(P)-dependent dehydrogenase (short-subunit alcohol dehydrogenase family)